MEHEYDKEKLECSVCKRMIQRKCLDGHQKTPTCQHKWFLFDKTAKDHYYDKNNTQETQKHIMKVQNANIVPQKQKVMKLMKNLGLNKMEKYIVDVNNV